jgi:hypothetical protein
MGLFVEFEECPTITQEAKSLLESFHSQCVNQNMLTPKDVGQAVPVLINVFCLNRFRAHLDHEMIFDQIGKALLKDEVGTESE